MLLFPNIIPGLKYPRMEGESLEEQVIALFAGGRQGVLYMPWLAGSTFQDAAGTTPAGDDDPVGRLVDWSGNNNHAVQATGAAQPVRQDTGGHVALVLDGVNDLLATSTTFTLSPGSTYTNIAVFRITSDTGAAAQMSVSGLMNAAISSRLDISVRSQPTVVIFQAMARSGGGTQLSSGTSNLGAPARVDGKLFRQTFDAGNLSFVIKDSGGTVTPAPASGSLSNSTTLPFLIGGVMGFTVEFQAALLIDRILTEAEIATVEAVFSTNTGVAIT